MQLFALNEEKSLTAASQAFKQKDYFCLECQQVVRVRQGIERIAHFYHVGSKGVCFLSGKTMEHMQVQLAIQKRLVDQECILEKRFPEINRIADVSWENQKIIFEVQCSPITADEIANRNSDYESIGYRVVWILHDSRYNKKKLTAIEYFLQPKDYYFTNIDVNGNGLIYDQLDFIFEGVREEVDGPLEIDVGQPLKIGKNVKGPKLIEHKLKRGLYFSNDLIDNLQDQVFLRKLLEKERVFCKKYFPDMVKDWDYAIRKLKKIYRIFFNLLLEKSCR